MNECLQQLESLRRHPALQVAPEQRPAIVGDILHHLMRPYFLKRTPEMQEKFGEPQYQTFMQMLSDYCLQDYVESAEPRLRVECIQGLHRVFYMNQPSVSVKAVDGSLTVMVPGEFKTVPVFIRRHSAPHDWLETTAPEEVGHSMTLLLETLHDENLPLMQRYIRFIVDLIHIHPFPDSNGKVAMLLGDLFLLKHGVHPPFYAKYTLENELLVLGLYDDYMVNGIRDISIFFPVLVQAYEVSGLIYQQASTLANSDQP